MGPKQGQGNVLQLAVLSNGCLNDSSLIQRYLIGNTTADEWGSKWDCVTGSLQKLQALASPGESFDAGEMQLLLENLVTDQPVPLELVQAGYVFKASLLGGSATAFNNDDINRLVSFLGTLKSVTTSLIPILALRSGAPSPANMQTLFEALQGAGANIASVLSTSSNPPFSQAQVDTLVRDLGSLLGFQADMSIEPAAWLGKTVLFGGSGSQIEAPLWPRIMSAAALGAGAMLALTSAQPSLATGPNEYGELAYAIVQAAGGLLSQGMAANGGAVPIARLEQLIAAVPANLLGGIRPSSVNSALAALSSTVFKSATPGSFDPQMLNGILSAVNRWRVGQTELETIFQNEAFNPADVETGEFVQAAQAWANQVDSSRKADVLRLAQLAQTYRSFFNEDDTQMSFITSLPQTLNNLTIIHWTNLLSGILVSAYTGQPLSASPQISLNQFEQLFTDFGGLGVDMHVIDTAVPSFPERRFNEADNYTLASEDNELLSVDAFTYYIGMMGSVYFLGQRIREDIEIPCNAGIGLDSMGWHYMDPECFRTMFFANIQKYWDHAPALQQYYATLSASDQASFQHDYENGARLYGYSDDPIGGYDTMTFASIAHYVEVLFARFDVNHDGVLETGESIEFSALVRAQIAAASGISPSSTGTLDGIFTYILNFEKFPANGFFGDLEVGAWILLKPVWNIHADRGSVYRMQSLFATKSE